MTNTTLNTNENGENTEVSMQDILNAWNGDGEITVTQSSSGEKVTPERIRELCDESIPGGVTTGVFSKSSDEIPDVESAGGLTDRYLICRNTISEWKSSRHAFKLVSEIARIIADAEKQHNAVVAKSKNPKAFIVSNGSPGNFMLFIEIYLSSILDGSEVKILIDGLSFKAESELRVVKDGIAHSRELCKSYNDRRVDKAIEAVELRLSLMNA